jgi:hypothetical protein
MSKICCCLSKSNSSPYLNLKKVEEDLKMKSGRGTTNLNYKCKFCKRDSTIDVVPDSYKHYICESEGFQEIISFDCRGVDLVSWEWKGTEGLVASVLEGEEFEVDLQQEEWSDYSEKTEQSVGIYKIFSKIK